MQKSEIDEGSTKKQSSYHYWHSKVPQSSIPINTAPQKIEAPVKISQEQPKMGPSSWNTSGTWEERKISLKQLDQKLSSTLVGNKTLKEDARIVSVSSQGQAALVFARGKKSLTYDLKINVEFQGMNDCEDCSGSLKFQQFSDIGDRSYSLLCENGEKKSILKESIKGEINRTIKIIESELCKYKQL